MKQVRSELTAEECNIYENKKTILKKTKKNNNTYVNKPKKSEDLTLQKKKKQGEIMI